MVVVNKLGPRVRRQRHPVWLPQRLHQQTRHHRRERISCAKLAHGNRKWAIALTVASFIPVTARVAWAYCGYKLARGGIYVDKTLSGAKYVGQSGRWVEDYHSMSSQERSLDGRRLPRKFIELNAGRPVGKLQSSI